jgi:hypothetical protein
MRVEDLVRGKKYRHPNFNIDLTYYTTNDGLPKLLFGEFIFTRADTKTYIILTSKDILELTEVREPIKKKQVSYCFTMKEQPEIYKASPEDIITGLRVYDVNYSLSETIQRLKADDYPSDFVVLKIISKIEELTEEEIEKELENEHS